MSDHHIDATPSVFRISLRVHVAVFLVASLIGAAIYGWFVGGAYEQLHAAYRQAPVIRPLLDTDPTIPADLTGRDPKVVLHRCLQLLGQRSLEDKVEDSGKKGDPHRRLFAAFPQPTDEGASTASIPNLVALGGGSSEGGSYGESPGVEIVVHVVRQILGGAPKKVSGGEMASSVSDMLAAVFAGQPGAAEDFISLCINDSEDSTAMQELAARYGENIGWEFDLSGEPAVQTADVLRALNHLYDVVEKESGLENASQDEVRLEILSVQEFAGSMIALLHADEGVKAARQTLSRWRGVEQLALAVFLAWTLLLLGIRRILRVECERTTDEIEESISGNLRFNMPPKERVGLINDFLQARKKVPAAQDSDYNGGSGVGLRERIRAMLSRHSDSTENLPIRLLDSTRNELTKNNRSPSANVMIRQCEAASSRLENSRWLLVWLSRAMPAVGFIGTVRGISGALRDADLIVRADSIAGQAAAITAVSGTLGIAFMTTFIALLFGLLTSFFSDQQDAREAEMIEHLEMTLLPLLEPTIAGGNQDAV